MKDMSAASGEALKGRIRASGAVAVGFARAGRVSREAREAFDRWLAAERHAGMDYLTRNADVRRDPRLLLDGARTVISMAFCYRAPGGVTNPYIAGYALLPDYHDFIRARLRAAGLEEFLGTEGTGWRICVDSAPVMERYWARLAGIGVTGENGAIIVPGVGPEVFLAEIITTREFTSDPPAAGTCSHCGRCRTACPGSALDASGIDCRRCLSYLTIEHRGEFTDPLHLEVLATPAGRGTLFGCDRCMRVCPHNNPQVTSDITPIAAAVALKPDDIPGMTPAEFSARFKGSPLKRARLAGLLRNAGNLQ